MFYFLDTRSVYAASAQRYSLVAMFLVHFTSIILHTSNQYFYLKLYLFPPQKWRYVNLLDPEVMVFHDDLSFAMKN